MLHLVLGMREEVTVGSCALVQIGSLWCTVHMCQKAHARYLQHDVL